MSGLMRTPACRYNGPPGGSSMEQPRDVLVRFHEIGLKGKNQPMFVRSLVDNLRRATAGLGVENVWSTRMLVRMRLAPTADQDAVIRRAGEVFGAVKINVVSRVDPTYRDIAACVLELAHEQPFSTFRMTANQHRQGLPPHLLRTERETRRRGAGSHRRSGLPPQR